MLGAYSQLKCKSATQSPVSSQLLWMTLYKRRNLKEDRDLFSTKLPTRPGYLFIDETQLRFEFLDIKLAQDLLFDMTSSPRFIPLDMTWPRFIFCFSICSSCSCCCYCCEFLGHKTTKQNHKSLWTLRLNLKPTDYDKRQYGNAQKSKGVMLRGSPPKN